MHKPTYYIETFGCQMNEHDSEVVAGIMESVGYAPAVSLETADVILFNTCCVRESAEQRIMGRISQVAPLKKKRPDILVGVGGCMVQYPEGLQRIKSRCPYVDFTFDTRHLEEIPSILEVHGADLTCPSPRLLPPRRKGRFSAFVTITYGCSNFCAYCIVPYVRGPEQSRPPQEIIREVTQLGEEGFKEVTLLGQNVNTYGRDLSINAASCGWDFGDLLLAIDDIPGIQRIRYMTSHPRDFRQKFIDIIARSKKACEHFHLPVQGGSDRILKLMNRGYTRDDFLSLVDRVRDAIPHASITTDIIVGFPGETDFDFEKTMDLVENVRFDTAYMFMYSPRSGTRAASLPDQVPNEIKKGRLEQLISVQNAMSKELNQEEKGRVIEVLVEGSSERNPGMLSGRSRTNKMVHFPGTDDLAGRLVNVLISDAPGFTLRGKIV
jgi:tRNA-2-methylthio-N6-dimethylallyladenosine synthase